MKTHQSALILITSLVGPSAMGQIIWTLNDHEEINRFGLSGRFAFNVSADFSGLGMVPAQSDPGPPPAPGGLPTEFKQVYYESIGGFVSRFYDDGYVALDSVGSTAVINMTDPDTLQTSNWSYHNASQDSGASLTFSSSRVDQTHDVRGVDADLGIGFEASYGRLVGRRGRVSWGYEVALGFASLSVEDNTVLTSDVEIIEDQFAYSAGPPPPPGTPGVEDRDGTPGAFLIFDEPFESNELTAPGAATTVGFRTLDTSLYSLRMGPFVELPVFKRASVSLGLGLSAVMINSEFEFRETTTFANMNPVLEPGVNNPQIHRGTESDSSLSFGYYLGGRFSYALNRRWDLFGGIDLQSMGTESVTAGGRKASIDLGTTIFASIGVGYYF